MIKYIVNEKDRKVTAKFVSNESKDTNRTIWLKYIVDGIYKSIKECKECSNVSLTDKIVYPRVKNFFERAELSNKFYYGIAKCNKIDTFDAKKGKYLAKKRLLEKYYKILSDVLLNLVYDINIPTFIPFKVYEDSMKKVNDISDEIHFFTKYGIRLDDIIKVQRKEVRSEDNMNNNNHEQKQDKAKEQLALGDINIDNIKIEVKDSVVRTSMSDGRNEYVYRVKSRDNSSNSLRNAITESIDYCLEYDTVIKNIIKEINSIRDIVCSSICKNKNIDMICDNCPFYSSSYGCKFSYINVQIYKEFWLLKINHEIERIKK